jgi:hypothetical protein
MYGCQRCQEQLLDHLYDLLSENEQAEVLAHLESCSLCCQALAAARDQQRLLATAAKRSFPEVTFGPPSTPLSPPAANETLPAPRPTSLPRAASGDSVRHTYALAALAAMLLLSLGLGQVWYLRGQQQTQRQQLASVLEASRDRLAQEETAQNQEVEILRLALKKEMQELQNKADSQHLRLVVTGPRHLPAGATAEYTVKTFDGQGKPLDALVMVEVDRPAPASGLLDSPRKDGSNRPGQEAGPWADPPASPSGGISRPGTMPTPAPSPLAPPAGPKDPLFGPGLPGGIGHGILGGSPEGGPGKAPGGTGGMPGTVPDRGVGRPALPPSPGGGRDLLAKDRPNKSPSDGKFAKGGRENPPTANTAESKDAKVERSKSIRREALPLKQIAPGTYTLTVPPDLVPEGRDLAMNVRARLLDAPPDRDELAIQGKVTLSAPVYRTYLSTDRPVYRPGETVRYRSLTLDRATNTPLADEVTVQCSLVLPDGEQRPIHSSPMRLIDKKGDPLLGPDGRPVQGITTGQFVLPPDLGTGLYTLKLHSESETIGETTRTFLVQNSRTPRRELKLDLHRSRYAPGDEVQATFHAHSLQGTPLAEGLVIATLTVDGTALRPEQTRTDTAGQAHLRFPLPRTIARGHVTLKATFTEKDGTVKDGTETITRLVPVTLDRVQMEFFPEGGDLVVGLPSRVYFSARTPLGQPTDIRGTLLENGKPTDVHLSTFTDPDHPGARQGLGVFAFTPKPEAEYTVRIDSPGAIALRPALPTPRSEGVTLRVEGGVFAAQDTLRVQIHSDRPRELLVGAFSRDGLLDSQIVPKGQTDVVLRPMRSPGKADGVCRITVFESRSSGDAQRTLTPLAERLIYRQPATTLDVKLQAEQKGDRVRVRLESRDGAGEPLPGLAQVSVVDQRMLSFGGDRTHPSMPTYFLLTSELRRAEDLEEADFLLGSHPKAPVVLDLLLGTQGWRRFAELPAAKEGARRPQEDRFLNLMGERTSHELSTLRQRSREVVDRYFHRGLDLLEAFQRQREQQLATWREAQTEALEQAERQFARWKLLRDGAALAAGLLAVVLLLVGMGVRTRGPWLMLSFALSATVWILLSLVPLVPHEGPTPSGFDPEPAERLSEANLGEILAGLREIEIPRLSLPGRPETAPQKPIVGGLPPHNPAKDLEFQKDEAQPNRTYEAKEIREARRTLQARRIADQLFEREKPFGAPLPVPGDADKSREDREGEGKGATGRVVREYGYLPSERFKPGAPGEPAETLYWHPVLVLPEGEGAFSFSLPGHPARYRATAYFHTLDGRLATATTTIESRPAAETDKRK